MTESRRLALARLFVSSSSFLLPVALHHTTENLCANSAHSEQHVSQIVNSHNTDDARKLVRAARVDQIYTTPPNSCALAPTSAPLDEFHERDVTGAVRVDLLEQAVHVHLRQQLADLFRTLLNPGFRSDAPI